jgi:hypothetical protein
MNAESAANTDALRARREIVAISTMVTLFGSFLLLIGVGTHHKTPLVISQSFRNREVRFSYAVSAQAMLNIFPSQER